MRGICFYVAYTVALAASPIYAQQTQPAAGPTMEQTITFIQDAFTTQGQFTSGGTTIDKQTIVLQSGCSPLLSMGLSNHSGRTQYVGILKLGSSDISSIAVIENGGYEVVLKGADYQQQLPDVVLRNTLQYQAGRAVPDHEWIVGLLESRRADSISIVTGDGIRWTAPLDTRTRALLYVSPSRGVAYNPMSVGDLADGDLVRLAPGRVKTRSGEDQYKGGHAIEDGALEITLIRKSIKGRQLVIVGRFQDKDIAERVAKAYVHAMALCHKDDQPSLF